MTFFRLSILIILTTLLFTCKSDLSVVYKIDVQQGNALDAEMVEKIEIGMTKEQVQYVLGNPLIIDSFHPERWDYIYLFIPGYGEQIRKQLTIIFDHGEVIEITKDNIVASNTAEVKREAGAANKKRVLVDENALSGHEKKKSDELEKLEKQTEI